MTFFPMYDVLSITDVFKLPYDMIKGISFALFPFLFAAAVLDLNIKAAAGQEADYKKLIKTVILVLCGLILYNHIFEKIIAICEVIAMSITDNVSIAKAIEFIGAESYAQVDARTGGGVLGKSVAAYNAISNLLTPKVFVLGFLSSVSMALEPIFLLVRYAFLGVLYLVGPLAFIGAIFGPTKSMLKGWFTSLFQISFWIITLRILETIIVSLELESWAQNGTIIDIIPWIAITATLIIFIVLTPIITSKILSGENLGAVASTMLAAGTLIAGHSGAAAAFVRSGKLGQMGQAIKNSSTGQAAASVVSGATNVVKSRFKKSSSDKSNTNSKEKPRR